jgi:putative FmdB family regulatory protein
MPLYVYGCEDCEFEDEVIQNIGIDELACPKCGRGMLKKPTCQSLVYMKGAPSFRKQYLGTAPYTSRVTGLENKGGHGSQSSAGKIEGGKWLESLE